MMKIELKMKSTMALKIKDNAENVWNWNTFAGKINYRNEELDSLVHI